MKKAGISLLIHRRNHATNERSGAIKLNGDKPMQFDPQIVSHAQAFVNALRKGKRARVPAIRLEHWQQFMTLVYAGLGLA
jgi:hypothetical protein